MTQATQLTLLGSDPQQVPSKEEWYAAAREALAWTARQHFTLTTDDVLEHYPELEAVAEPRAWGPVMQWGCREGLIWPMDYGQSRRKRSHKRPKRTWKSLVFG